MQVWRQGHAQGKLNAVQTLFFAPSKSVEELYDTTADPFEVRNLADDPQHSARLAELRAACDQWLVKTDDKGAVPVEELIRRGIISERDSKYDERRQRAR